MKTRTIDSIRALALLTCVVIQFGADRPRAADLLQLYTRATEFDAAFQSARYEREVADAILQESRAGVLPSVSANVEASKVYQDIRESESLLFTPGKTDFFNDSYSISLVQPLYRAESFTRIPQARAQIKEAAALYAAAEQDLVYRVAEAHFGLLAAREDLEFASAEREAIQRQLEETEERLAAGLANLTDVHDARARFALGQAAEVDALDALEANRQAVAELTGELPTDLKALSEDFPLVEPDRPDVEAWVKAALFQNPDIKAREAGVEIAEKEIRVQRGARQPSVDLVSSWVRRDSGGTEFGGGNEIETANIAVRVGIPVYDGGRTSALARSAMLRHKIAQQKLEQQKRQVERETREAFQGVMGGITRVKALSKSVLSHEAALARKEEGMRSGLNTGLEVLDARRDLFLAKRDLTRARYLYILDTLKLKKAAGTLGVEDLGRINAYLQ